MQNECKKPQLSKRNKHKVDRYDTRHVIKGKTGVKGWNLSPVGWSKIILRFKDNTWNVILVISTQVIAQGYVSENKESRRTKYCKEALMITTVLFVI